MFSAKTTAVGLIGDMEETGRVSLVSEAYEQRALGEWLAKTRLPENRELTCQN